MQLEIKYSSSTYSLLCFRHAVQEAMRGENVESYLAEQESNDYYDPECCNLCTMEHDPEENALAEWYGNYMKTLEDLVPKRPTKEELRKEATKLRSTRKGNV